jgi:3-oxoacyl-[acyl-carrier protein] reductase
MIAIDNGFYRIHFLPLNFSNWRTPLKPIEDFFVGQKAQLIKCIEADDIDKFVQLTGDDNPLHVDEGFAQSTDCRGIVAHGMLGASFLSTVIGKHLPGEGALWLSNHMDFHAPVRIGDTLTINAEIIQLIPNHRMMKLSVTITNQLNQVVTTAECKVKLLAAKTPKIETEKDSDRTIVLTGAGSGIAQSLISILQNRGYSLVLHYRNHPNNASALESPQDSSSVRTVCGNLESEDTIKKIAQLASQGSGSVWGLVNLASPPIRDLPWDKVTHSDLMEHFRIQVESTLALIQTLVPLMKSDGGSIVQMGSIVTQEEPPALWLPYTIAKHALHGLTRSLVRPLAAHHIRINTVSPGLTETPLTLHLPERTRLLTEQQTPLKTLAQSMDVAHAIAYFLSDEAKHVTGAELKVNGGKVLA